LLPTTDLAKTFHHFSKTPNTPKKIHRHQLLLLPIPVVLPTNLLPVDEPHGSLFAYFRIFALLADNHMIASHVTGITQPILTFTDHFQSFLVICDDFYLWATSRAHCNSRISTMQHCGSYTVR
jgi:hypothetical protein